MSEIYEFGFVSNVITTVDYKKIPKWVEYCKSKIRGVNSYDVPFGELKEGIPLQMIEDGDDIYFAYGGEYIGWLKPKRVPETRALIRAGHKFRVTVLQVTGGTFKKVFKGVNIKIEIMHPFGVKPVIQSTLGVVSEA